MGRWKVQIQLWLTAAVINIKRAVKQLARREPATWSNEATSRAFIPGMFADAAKEIAGVLHRILFCLQQYFGNSPSINGTLLRLMYRGNTCLSCLPPVPGTSRPPGAHLTILTFVQFCSMLGTSAVRLRIAQAYQ